MKLRPLSLLLLSSFIIGCSPITENNHVLNMQNSIQDSGRISLNSTNETETNPSNSDIFEVHSINLHYKGDCNIVKFGNTEILIDAGGGEPSGEYIKTALERYVTDGVLEYAIFTHADDDHIHSFYDPKGLNGWINTQGHCINTLIDFDMTQDPTIDINMCHFKYTLFANDAPYLKYAAQRALLIGTKIKKYYPVSQCVYQQRGVSKSKVKAGATNLFILNDGNNHEAEMKILYNYFFDHSYDYFKGNYDNHGAPNSADKNLISIPVLFTYNSKKFLFTGDLEEYNTNNYMNRCYGETLLVENNFDDLKDGVLFYKAAHHGSRSSNSVNLLDVIRPEYVSINAMLNGDYNHPHQLSLTGFQKWTDYIYINGIKNEDGTIVEFHGDVNFIYNNGRMIVNYSNSSMPMSIFDNPYFFLNREAACNIYNLNFELDNYGDVIMPSGGNLIYNATYIKAGHIDILVGAGIRKSQASATGQTYFKKQIKYLCNDRKIDYLIIPSLSYEYITDLVGGLEMKNGLLYDPYFENFGTIVYPKYSKYSSDSVKQLKNMLSELTIENKVDGVFDSAEITSSKNNAGLIRLNKDYVKGNSIELFLKFLDTPYNDAPGDIKNFHDNTLSFIFTFDNYTYLNVGEQYDDEKLIHMLEMNKDYLLKKVSCFQIPYNGNCNPITAQNSNILIDGSINLNSIDKSQINMLTFLKLIKNANASLDLLFSGNYIIDKPNNNPSPSSFYRYLKKQYESIIEPRIYATNIIGNTPLDYNLPYIQLELLKPLQKAPYTPSHVYNYHYNLNSLSYSGSYRIVDTVDDFISNL